MDKETVETRGGGATTDNTNNVGQKDDIVIHIVEASTNKDGNAEVVPATCPLSVNVKKDNDVEVTSPLSHKRRKFNEIAEHGQVFRQLSAEICAVAMQ